VAGSKGELGIDLALLFGNEKGTAKRRLFDLSNYKLDTKNEQNPIKKFFV